MKKLFLCLFLLVFLSPAKIINIAPVDVVHAQTPKNAVQGILGGKNAILEGSTTLEMYVHQQSNAFGVNPALSNCLITHESQWIPTKDGKDTGNTISRGLWQWNSYWHPEISNVCAHDPKCATPKALAWIVKGHVSQWSTYHEYCDNIPVKIRK